MIQESTKLSEEFWNWFKQNQKNHLITAVLFVFASSLIGLFLAFFGSQMINITTVILLLSLQLVLTFWYKVAIYRIQKRIYGRNIYEQAVLGAGIKQWNKNRNKGS